MKNSLIALILGLLALSAGAQDVAPVGIPSASESAAAPSASPASDVPASVTLPDGVVTETHPLKRAYLDKTKFVPALFRPSDSMPSVVNEDLLRGMTESGKNPKRTSQQIGYLPRLKVLPCETGCEGPEYELAVAEFIKGYRGDGKNFQERGELVVQVRWFHVRPYLSMWLPYSADLFGVSFALEGKLVSLGRTSGVGIIYHARDLARQVGERLAGELAYTLGVGARPAFLFGKGSSMSDTISEAHVKLMKLGGSEDVRSRIEPLTDAHKHLLPAIDGILPGEVHPISEVRFINNLVF